MAISPVSTAQPLATTGVPAAANVYAANQPAAPTTPQPGTTPAAGNAAINTTYTPNVSPSMDVGSAAGGGLLEDAANAVTRLTAFAQTKMDSVQDKINGLFASEGGEIDAAKLQIYSQEMSSYEMMMQMAAKIQEKEERAISVWLR